MTAIKLRSKVNFPATVTATGGLAVAKANGIWTVEPDWSYLSLETTLPDASGRQLWTYDPTADSYYRLSVQALIDNLPDGPPGEAATIAAGITTTGNAGTSASASNSGTAQDAILDFTIPRGADSGIRYVFEASTSMAAPASGGLRLNNASLASVTAIAVNATNSDAVDVSDFIATWDDSTNTVKGYVEVRKEGSGAVLGLYQLTSVTDNTTWLQFAVTYVSGSGSFTAADSLYLTPYRVGNKGTDGAGTGDFSSNTATSVDGEMLLFSGTGGKTGKRSTLTGGLLKSTSGVPAIAAAGTDYLAPSAIGVTVQAYDADLAAIAALDDPNADRLLFWDDSAGAYTYLTLNAGLEISGTTLRAIEAHGIALSDETTAITTGTNKATFSLPYAFTVTAVYATLSTVSSSGIPTVDINEAGTTILSTKLTIDASEKTSATAANAAVISDASIAANAEIGFDIDVAGTGAKGLKVFIQGYRI